jgi:hypothetical protein
MSKYYGNEEVKIIDVTHFEKFGLVEVIFIEDGRKTLIDAKAITDKKSNEKSLGLLSGGKP